MKKNTITSFEAVLDRELQYKAALLGMFREAEAETREDNFCAAAIEYERSLKAAIKYLTSELQRLKEEVSDYVD